MILAVECVVFCLLMGTMCFLGVGNDEKNIKSFRSYPDELQELLQKDENYKNKIKTVSPVASFVSNFLMFLVIVFIFGIFIRTKDFLHNFVALLILGQVMNVFDLLLDLFWFRNTKRTRFSNYPDPKLYKNPKNHINSFIKALFMFTLVALVDAALLILF